MKTKASVKIMRSYDYNHFEVSLSTDELIDEKEVNSLIIKAAKLVDHAIEQYKKKKSAEAYSANNIYMRAELERKVKAIITKIFHNLNGLLSKRQLLSSFLI